MREEVGDLWTYPCDARCVTTNGVVKANGELVMGAGVAKEAAKRYPHLPRFLGNYVKAFGNFPAIHHVGKDVLISFPTKHHWKHESDFRLIHRSAKHLFDIVDEYDFKVVAMTRPGCGLGGLQWDEVKKVLAPLLDDRFVVLTSK